MRNKTTTNPRFGPTPNITINQSKGAPTIAIAVQSHHAKRGATDMKNHKGEQTKKGRQRRSTSISSE
jgi:hypothetical protein